MKYLDYIVAAYAVFFAFLAWDLLAPLIRARKAIRAARLRIKRESSRKQPAGKP